MWEHVIAFSLHFRGDDGVERPPPLFAEFRFSEQLTVTTRCARRRTVLRGLVPRAPNFAVKTRSSRLRRSHRLSAAGDGGDGRAFSVSAGLRRACGYFFHFSFGNSPVTLSRRRIRFLGVRGVWGGVFFSRGPFSSGRRAGMWTTGSSCRSWTRGWGEARAWSTSGRRPARGGGRGSGTR